MVTATAFQILVSNNVPIKGTTDNIITTLEVTMEPTTDHLLLHDLTGLVWSAVLGSAPFNSSRFVQGSAARHGGGCPHRRRHCPL